jgi:rare lipoprotein A
MKRYAIFAASAAATLLITGCQHQTQVAYQPPPPASSTARYQPHTRPGEKPSAGIPATTEAETVPPGFFDDTRGKPVFTETGTASWYGPGHNHRHAADGTIFDQDAMTAAHRTLPLGSTVRVTNLTTGQQVLVRITDRGPFSPSRVLDLSMGAAKAVGIYRAGIAKVKIEAFAHPSADPNGKWCVQTGAFKSESDAIDLKSALLDRYRGSRVTEFGGPTGFWVRCDPPQRDKKTADKILEWIGAPDTQSQAYLVRLD